jgi:hypothetical protein
LTLRSESDITESDCETGFEAVFTSVAGGAAHFAFFGGGGTPWIRDYAIRRSSIEWPRGKATSGFSKERDLMRRFYRSLLWLHPASFEEQFGEEMLWIFDLRRASETGLALLFDAFVSLCRQWMLRSGVWKFGVGVLVNLLLGHRLILFCLGLGS